MYLVPYFSGAANYQLPNKWLFLEQEVYTYKLLNTSLKENYRFKVNASKAVLYNYNHIGLVYIISIATSIFFWLGDVSALEWFQIAVHCLTSIWILGFLRTPISRLLFIMLYVFNPLIIYFVTFPYYYFWQVVATASIVPYLWNKSFKYKNYIWLVASLLALIQLTRPTIILIPVLFFVLYFFFESPWKSIIGLILFLVLINIFTARKLDNAPTYWHTVFVGIGAYPNDYITTLSDNEAYNFFNRKTAKNITYTIPGGNVYTDLSIRNEYFTFLKNEYFQVLKSHPILLIKNAVLNFFQSFSLGYFVDYPLWVNYLSSLAGFIFFILLFLKKHFLWIMAIAFNSLTFTPYYPPIQAYMFGGYILIICAFIQLLNDFDIIRKLNSWIQNSKIYPMLPSA
ncbi:hypothetical protein Q0590_07120 [Rhodocytophaga aerolata]|uniref:Glycosyltransferase family 39 protein n=1 Tax=Rhodocytophaga aerolata TaxID=455078 RepID=A0ABT8R1P1_9BACT|nr:hypothetical protein [Rhodocytophaga aerolata]